MSAANRADTAAVAGTRPRRATGRTVGWVGSTNPAYVLVMRMQRKLRQSSAGPCGARTSSPGTRAAAARRRASPPRTEEHTSELQSLMRISYAVFYLKKKTHLTQHSQVTTINNILITGSYE